jgi:disulfide bond formation protein DsbB
MSGQAKGWMLVFGAWLIAATATLGSLFLSDVMHLAPCSLCWYQRIFMFSLAVILTFCALPV